MKYIKSSVTFTVMLAAACASNPSPSTGPSSSAAVAPAAVPPPRPLPNPETPAGNPANYIGDPELYTLLAHTPLDIAARAALGEYRYKMGGTFADRLGEVAEDSSASVSARVNALALIGELDSKRQFEPIRTALHAKDPRVRASALNAAEQLRRSNATDALVLIREALNDSAPEIQTKALQFLGDTDISLLRDIVKSPSRSPVVVEVVRNLIEVAEDRGAPLVAADTTTGVLERRTAAGYTVRFTPTSRWTMWSASAGRVTLRTPQGKTAEIPGTFEVVGNVVPLFFSADGKYIVYESDRHVHVRDLASGIDRDLGPGVAPRLRPVTDQFIYVVEDTTARAPMRDRTKVKYQIYSAPFALTGAAPVLLGAAGGFLEQAKYGNYSPVRWMRVEETDGTFFLVADSLEMFALPSPFTGGSGS